MKKTRAQKNKKKSVILSDKSFLDKALIHIEMDENIFYVKAKMVLFHYTTFGFIVVLGLFLFFTLQFFYDTRAFSQGLIYVSLILGVPLFTFGFLVFFRQWTDFVKITNHEIEFRHFFVYKKFALDPDMKVKIKRYLDTVDNVGSSNTYKTKHLNVKLILITKEGSFKMLDISVLARHSKKGNVLCSEIAREIRERINASQKH